MPSRVNGGASGLAAGNIPMYLNDALKLTTTAIAQSNGTDNFTKFVTDRGIKWKRHNTPWNARWQPCGNDTTSHYP